LYGEKYKDAKLETSEENHASDLEIDNLALLLSGVLNNPHLPVPIYNAILHGTDEIINTSSSDVMTKYETSPEHMKAVLKLS
jgi:hypothetical protein